MVLDAFLKDSGLLRRVAPRNDGKNFLDSILVRTTDLPVVPICRS
jgi:hypothetical protein